MKKYLLSIAALAATTFGAFADPASGDVYDISIVNEYGGIIPTKTSPLTIGERVTIKMRLLNRGYNLLATARKWYFAPNWPTDTTRPEESIFGPQFGLMLGGQEVFADYIGQKQVEIEGINKFTDLYFQYTVKAGDLALPANLLWTKSDSEFAIRYTNYLGMYWKLTNDDSNECVLSYSPKSPTPDPDPYAARPAQPTTGVDLGIYVQTVWFDKNNDYKPETSPGAKDDVWRLFYKGDSTFKALPTTPTITLEGIAAQDTTMYVWVKDTLIANVVSGDNYEEITDINPYDSSKTYTRYVLKVPIKQGTNYANFRLAGIGTGTTTVRMSSSQHLTFNKAGDLVEDWIERNIEVAEMPNPYVSLQIQGPDGQPLEKNTTSLTAEYDKPIARFVLSLMKAPSSTMTVKLVPDLADGDIVLDGLLGISEEETGTPWEETQLTIEFKPEDPLTKTLYVYGKGTTGKFSTSGCKFTIKTSGASEYDGESGKHSANMILKHMTPMITKPTSGDAITNAMAGKSYALDIAISDARKYMEEAASGDVAYTVYYKVEASGTESEWQSDAMFLNDADSGEATISIPFDVEGECQLRIYVLNTVNNKKSKEVAIPVKVSAPKRAIATLDRVNGVYAEGETAYVNIKLTQKYKDELYAFLVPQDDETKTKFETDISSETSGVIGYYIGPNETETKIPTEVRVNDGKAIGRFQLFMCTTKNYSKIKSAGYIGDVFTISATNVVPRITRVSMGGADVDASGGRIEKAIAMDTTKTFTLEVEDPSRPDLEATGGDAFHVQWKVGTSDWVDVRGNPEDKINTKFEHLFSAPGEQIIKVRCRDKDMSALNKWSEEFTFTVNVLDTPRIVITPALGVQTFTETDTGATKSLFNVSLTAAPTLSGGKKLPIKLTVEKPNGAPAGYTVEQCKLSKDLLEFASGVDKGPSFYLRELDGTIGSSSYGFIIKAEIDTGRLPGGKDDDGNTWEAGEIDITVLNNDPEITAPAEDPLDKDDNPVPTPAQIGTPITLNWGVKDIEADKKGLTVEWTVDGTKTVYKQGEGAGTVPDASFGEHTFTFQSSGEKQVIMKVTDKDGGTASRTFHYTIEASKTLVVSAHGPAAKTASNNGLSMSYGSAPGLGAGRVDAVGRDPSKVDSWVSSFTVGISSSDIMVTATGYTVGDVNNKIDANGNYPKATSDYQYNNQAQLGADGYDSFVYAWIYNNIVKETAVGDKDIIFAMGKMANAPLPLPMDESSDDDKKQAAFATQYWEALFSREFYAQDNCGDINLDGIPDVYALRYAPDIFTYRTSELVGDDLKNIADANIDEDYLPNTDTASIAHFVPGLSNTWVTIGRAFQMRDELRGYGPHFNDATAAVFPDGQANRVPIEGVISDKKYTDPNVDPDSTLTYVEWVAFTNYCDRAGLGDPMDSALLPVLQTKWSPERPTDPTLADTDADGMPDGYEYYFWYKAHVGWLEEKKENNQTITNYVRLTGRRYNQFSPCEPITITADEIEKLYDPIVPNNFAPDTDTDNDGLPDLIEFEIGTNPFDYDSDNDGLPDGWEVVMSNGDKVLDPLKAATTLAGFDGNWNPDGDQMALVEIPAFRAKVTYTNDLSKTNFIYVLRGERDPDNFVAQVQRLREDSDDTIGIGKFTSDPKARLTLAEGMLYKLGNPDTYVLTKIIANELDKTENGYKNAVEAIRIVETISVADENRLNLNVIHWFVHTIKGFHPWTAWKKPNPPNLHRVNTSVYTTYDEFMLMAFCYQAGVLPGNDITPQGASTFMDIWPKCTTQPFIADTDEDGMPDGWELFVMGAGDPRSNPYSPLFPFGMVTDTIIRDPDEDGLDFLQEFNGVECCDEYGDCETINNGAPDWRNKAWPTDPNFMDTDGDGLSDGAEHVWLYGTSGVDGGGLNPHSMDTDKDGLPDPWELEFMGSYSTNTTAQEVTSETVSDGTNDVTAVSTNTTTQAGHFLGGGMNPTGADARADYDYDGLQNWQEYMIGAMRCWRYDDTTSPWQPHKISDTTTLGQILGNDQKLAETILDPWTTEVKETMVEERTRVAEFNPGFASGYFNVGVYFTCVTKDYDQCYGNWYMLKDGIYHDLADDSADRSVYKLSGSNPYGDYFKRGFVGVKYCNVGDDNEKHLNRWNAPYFAANLTPIHFDVLTGGTSGLSLFPRRYICCDPRNADSDGDGMDDYYEIFHGLNPLLGAAGSEGKDGGPRDLIYIAYGGSQRSAPHATANYWLENVGGTWTRYHSPKIRSTALLTGDMADMEESNLVKDATMTGLCFHEFPWLTGLISADVDGDNIRNEQEAILPNPQAAPTYQHTDPTPLWLTDSDSPDSITYRFYGITTPFWANTLDFPVSSRNRFEYEGKSYPIFGFPWIIYNPIRAQIEAVDYRINIGERSNWLYDFEENEGYDSDHDYLSDFEENQGRTKTASDPQVFDDPIRHQAMYFNGEDAFLQTPLEESLVLPTLSAEAENRQDFLYFTAEAWVKPDAAILEDGLHTVLERALYSGMAGPADERYLRRNFYIGINDGKWYAYFDSTGTDAKKYVAIENGPVASTNWTHVAVSYGPTDNDEYDIEEPMMLKLFINGECVAKKKTALQPEHGTVSIIITNVGGDNASRSWNATPTFLVGASVKNSVALSFDTTWRTRVEDDTNTQTVLPVIDPTFGPTFDDYDNYFKGYIDEVRIWDGARKPSEIEADVKNKVRYDFAKVEANREKVYKAWAQGARRHATSAQDTTLPAEIRCHWSFDHLPGAVETGDVMQVPAGFSTARWVTDSMAIWARPEGWTNAWWDSVQVRSTVYTDTAWVPWINNTVAHVKNMDGTTFDTMFWTEQYCGNMPASFFGFSKFAFPRTAEVYSRIRQNTYLEGDYLYSPSTRWDLMTNATERTQYRYTRRNFNVVGSDILPMGGAYPKRISTTEGGMWDDGLAADPWAETGADADDNGLPDWWERYARRNLATGVKPWETLDRNMLVVYPATGAVMPLWQAYIRDLAKGMLPDGNLHPEYADWRDADFDGIPDWWEDIYGIDGHSANDGRLDLDGDGLSNLAEYRISEIYHYADCDPMQAKTDGLCIDAYKKVGHLYLGEIFSDHDHIDDVWEDQYMNVVPGTANEYFTSRSIFDPFADGDDDGWSNYAEYRANTDPSTSQALSIDGYTCPEYPLPVVEADIRYHGVDKISGPLVFQAWNQKLDYDMVNQPAATWTLGTAEPTSETEGGSSQTSANTQGSALQQHEKFIGRKPKGERTFYLTGGNVSEGSVKLLLLDKGYGLVTPDPLSGGYYVVGSGEPDDAVWYYMIYDRGGELVVLGNSVDKALGYDEQIVGTINYRTGRVTIDFDHEVLSKPFAGEPANAESGDDSSGTTEENIYHWVDPDNSYFRIEWKSAQAMMSSTGVHYFCEPDSGHLREGLTSFICFADADGDGKYTPGELMGFVRDVDVGWSSAKFVVELTETHPIFGRVGFDGANDRYVWYGIDSGNITDMVYQASESIDSTAGSATGTQVDSTLSGGKLQHVRIDRYAVNGVELGITTNNINVADCVIVDKWFNVGARSFIFEGDFMEPGTFDIDWVRFKQDIADNPIVNLRWQDVSSVSYRIVIDNAEMVHPALSNRVINVAFTRWFDSKNARQKPTGLKSIVSYGARPTFSWSMKDEKGNIHNTYTAFKLQIRNGEEVIYESPMTRAPVTDAEGNYVWTAPFSIGDQTPQGKVLALSGNYQWTVSMYNTKFQTDAYATPAGLTVSVNQRQEVDDYGYNMINVAVKYAGPYAVIADCADTTKTEGKVRVQAFLSQDFSDVPMAEMLVTDPRSISNMSNHTANVTLAGLPAGEYFLRAYIDSNGNFVKDDFESWGYAKSAVTVGLGKAAPYAEINIDDADTDGDWVPDAWEYAQYKSLNTLNPKVDSSGQLVLIGLTYSEPIQNSVMSAFGDTSSAFFQNLNASRMMVAGTVDPSVDAVEAIQQMIEKKIVPDSVKISSLEVDAANRQIILKVDGEVAESDAIAILPYVSSAPTQFALKIYRKNSLVDANWGEPVEVKTLQVFDSFEQTIVVPIAEIDLNSGFYKVEVVQ